MLRQIQNTVRSGAYDLTFHASEELAEDALDILDLETALLGGEVIPELLTWPRANRGRTGRVRV
ncbi:MAG TPA: hypothetical protein VJL07_05430 [Dehalococcoidia bacterium]|nr:hypothetical protein [Dehalococcoidia bacterium]